ncbi:hypothetical protein FACS189443_2710 [Planctomycetales bacterium]|nr:hypothetical protein FACS189443_2710 [Planctomycetales bacterium]
MKTKTNKRIGFTLVELLVVISIITMLAGLLLPAVQAAREAGRRAACMSNQSNIAFALINYENTRGHLPPLRAKMQYSGGSAGQSVAANELSTTAASAVGNLPTELTWIGFLMPFLELNNAWASLSQDQVLAVDHPIYDLNLPVFKCKSSGLSSGDSKINYVVNAGAQNIQGLKTLASNAINGAANGSFWRNTANGYQKMEYNMDSYWGNSDENKRFAVFFDHFAYVDKGAAATLYPADAPRCTTTMTLDFISANNGTSYCILLSENIDAGHWIWADRELTGGGTTGLPEGYRPRAYDSVVANAPDYKGDYLGYGEDLVGFVYPPRILDATGTTATTLEGTPDYVSLVTATSFDQYLSPLFINEGRSGSGVVFATSAAGANAVTHKYRTARPSSNHPGVVVAAFADRSVRVLKDDMSRMLFVHLCRPSSGVVVNPKDLD